jgi:hypothetical protein
VEQSSPALREVLREFTAVGRDEGGSDACSLPHERVLARAWGWPAADGLLPFAALAAHEDGLPVFNDGSASRSDAAWGLLQPAHWRVGREQVALSDPRGLALEAEESRALFASLKPLFGDDDWSLHWGSAQRWHVSHPSLARLPTASLDRVVGRHIDPWLRAHPEARAIRRLQAEAQMLWHEHPVNQAREARGLEPVNSFWLSGTGPTPATLPAPSGLALDDCLRSPALADDGLAWREAWAALDAGPLRALLAEARSGGAARLTLCGERMALTLAAEPRPWWRRGLLAPRLSGVAETLATL